MSKTTIAVIDYGMGNLHSVASALQYVAPDAEVHITSDLSVVRRADRVVFPGVGAIRDCMAEIRRLHFDQSIAVEIASGKPVLAICVGLQALMEHSDENGGVECLGYFAGQVKSFAAYPQFQRVAEGGLSGGERLKVPHMGWNQVQQAPHPLWQGIPNNSRFYFVHSYCVQSQEPAAIVGSCHYGVPFSAALARKNVFATQFHPEKSSEHGLRLLKNFVHWDGCR
jgi:imidazole glycerol-phosphate synthase subunit HisH